MKQFEQHEYIFDLESEEFPQLEGLNPLQTGQLLQSLLVINGLLAQRAEGYIDKDEYDQRRVRIMSLLSESVKGKLMEVLKVD
jgi:hypothetical protein